LKSPLIQIQNLSKTYKGSLTPAVDGLSFELPTGTISGLLGPNGAGKTTTISILCGLLSFDSGSVQVGGYDIKTQKQAILNTIGIVPQQIALYNKLNAIENLSYFGKLYGLKNPFLKTKINDLLEHFGLAQHAKKEVGNYSGGMKRRINIIAALLHNPCILILDEPTAGVDVQSRAMILSFLKDYAQQGNSVVYTSHLLEEAQQICQEVVVIDNGQLVAQGSPQSLIDHHNAHNLEDVFLKLTGRQVRE
jgi:ABC-2 type transport system ATP-binding protein